eukprot:776561-Amphidinium_carterae.1
MGGPQGSNARGFDSERLTANGSAERNSAGGRQRQGGGVHAVLDREVPGPACPLLKKACDAFLERKIVDQPDDFERSGLDRWIIFARALRSVSDQLSVRGSSATSCCDDWGAGARSTLLRAPSAALMDPGREASGLGWLNDYHPEARHYRLLSTCVRTLMIVKLHLCVSSCSSGVSSAEDMFRNVPLAMLTIFRCLMGDCE